MATMQKTMNMKQIVAVGFGVPEDRAIRTVSPRKEQPLLPKPRPAERDAASDATENIIIW